MYSPFTTRSLPSMAERRECAIEACFCRHWRGLTSPMHILKMQTWYVSLPFTFPGSCAIILLWTEISGPVLSQASYSWNSMGSSFTLPRRMLLKQSLGLRPAPSTKSNSRLGYVLRPNHVERRRKFDLTCLVQPPSPTLNLFAHGFENQSCSARLGRRIVPLRCLRGDSPRGVAIHSRRASAGRRLEARRRRAVVFRAPAGGRRNALPRGDEPAVSNFHVNIGFHM